MVSTVSWALKLHDESFRNYGVYFNTEKQCSQNEIVPCYILKQSKKNADDETIEWE